MTVFKKSSLRVLASLILLAALLTVSTNEPAHAQIGFGCSTRCFIAKAVCDTNCDDLPTSIQRNACRVGCQSTYIACLNRCP